MPIEGMPPKEPGPTGGKPGSAKPKVKEGSQKGRKLAARSSQKQRWIQESRTRKDARRLASYDTEVVESEGADSSDFKSHPGAKMEHKGSVDSGIGSLYGTNSSLDQHLDLEEGFPVLEPVAEYPGLSDEDRQAVHDGFKKIADKLYHLGQYEVSELPGAIESFTGDSAKSLARALATVGLEFSWEKICENAVELLRWAGTGEVLALPRSLAKAAQKKQDLDVKAGEALNQTIDADGGLKRTFYKNKAVRLRNASVKHVDGVYSREFLSYQSELDDYISAQSASRELHEHYDFLNSALFERYGLENHSGIVKTVEREWVKSILMGRAIDQSSIAGKGLL